jgi:hypothetical protein
MHDSGASRREVVKSRLDVIASQRVAYNWIALLFDN